MKRVETSAITTTIMNRGKTSDSIPIDLIYEIFSRLPIKSIARFRCVSKLWDSMFYLPYFRELFLTRSLSRPRLLFLVQDFTEWTLFSSPQPQIPYEKSSSLVVTAELHMKFPRFWRISCSYASGLICFSSFVDEPVIFNPNTGQQVILPKPQSRQNILLGFDPIGKQYKALLMDITNYKILTLGTGIMKWRQIKCPLFHVPYQPQFGSIVHVCMTGIVYYLANIYESFVVVCFDVRSEKFNVVNIEKISFSDTIVNYKGKLGVFYWKLEDLALNKPFTLRLWVLEDVGKQEWSKYLYTLPNINEVAELTDSSVAGVTATGQIVLMMNYKENYGPYYVFYFNPERKTIQRVEIQGFGAYLKAFYNLNTFVDHVEDLNLMDVKLFKLSIAPPSEKNKRSLYMRYDDGVSREKKKNERQRERDERNSGEDEERRRRREEMRDRERRVESRRYRDGHWTDRESKGRGE